MSSESLTGVGQAAGRDGHQRVDVYSVPQLRWYYYNPTAQTRSSLPLPSPMYSPPMPPPTDPVLAFRALQSQLTAFQDTLGNVNADVKQALAQLHELRTAQNRTDKRIAELQDMIGVTSTGTRARGRGRQTKVRGEKEGAHGEPPLDVDGADAETVPVKTLVQSVTFIQSAVEALLARDNLNPCPPSTNLMGQEPSHISLPLLDTSKQLSILQSTRSIPSTSQSESPSSIAIPNPEFSSASPSYSPSGLESAKASIQASSPSSTPESSCPSSYSHSHALGFAPVNWGIDAVTLAQPASDLIRPTEHSTHLLRDISIPSSTNTEADSQTFQRLNDRGLTASDTRLPTHVMSTHATDPDTLVVPLISSTAQSSLQTPFFTTLAINSSSGTGSSGDSPVSPTSPLDSLIGDTPIPVSGAPAAPGCGRQSTPVETNNKELPSGLPTPPSEALTDSREARVASRLTRECAASSDGKLVSLTHLARNFPIIPTPPTLTPEPSVRGSVQQDSLEVDSGSLSSLTPPPLSLSSAVGSSQLEGDVEDLNGREEHTNPLDNARPTIVSRSDATEGVAVDVEQTTFTVDSKVPIITVADEPPRTVAESADNLSPVGSDLFSTSKSSAGQRECLPGSDGMSPRYSQMDGYDFHFSFPLHHPLPPTSSAPSRYATPSNVSNSGPTPEEDEVWGALVRDASGVSTPTLVYPLPLVSSPQTMRDVSVPPFSEPLAVDPSMLHEPPLPSELQHSPLASNTSLSSLTSLGDIDREQSSVPTRVASEAGVDGSTESRGVGGPSASLSELALLARRKPLKIRLRLPEKMRKLKRKRDAGDEVGEKDDGLFEDVSPDRLGAMRSGSSAPGPSVAQLPPESSPSSHPRPAVGAGESPNLGPCLTAPRKRTKTKKREECDEKEVRAMRPAPVQKQECKPGSKGKSKVPVKYHVWKGQIVSVELDPDPTPTLPPEPQPQMSTASPVSQPTIRAEDGQDAQSPTRQRHRKERGNEAPSSSPASRRISRIPRTIKPSPKAEMWNTIYRDGGRWPELPGTFSHWDLQFIQCDNCDKWYHYGCVAIGPGDPRLEPGTLFICPRCHSQSARRQTLRHRDDTCARPNCPEPQMTSDTETYYVEKLVGRKRLEGYIYMWLAKWEGYPMSQATWIPKENVIGDGTKMFNTFLEDAVEEGADLDQEVVLLREALDAGWSGDEC